MLKSALLWSLIFIVNFAVGQSLSGIICDSQNIPVAYVNIGLIGKNLGTVTNQMGRFTILIPDSISQAQVKISMLGFESKTMSLQDFKQACNNTAPTIVLQKRNLELKEVLVKPRVLKPKTLGNSSKSKMISAGFNENALGYEVGVVVKNKQYCELNKVAINFAFCTYDSVFYRLNIYQIIDNQPIHLLQQPIYLQYAKQELENTIYVDLKPYYLNSYTDFLIALEHVKDLGPGKLNFCAGFFNHKIMYRKTSQGIWETAPVGISIAVDAMVEK